MQALGRNPRGYAKAMHQIISRVHSGTGKRVGPAHNFASCWAAASRPRRSLAGRGRRAYAVDGRFNLVGFHTAV